MIEWALRHLVIWSVRVGVLLMSCCTLAGLLARLNYRVDFATLLVVGLLAIVTVRVWMPWAPDRPSRDRLE